MSSKPSSIWGFQNPLCPVTGEPPRWGAFEEEHFLSPLLKQFHFSRVRWKWVIAMVSEKSPLSSAWQSIAQGCRKVEYTERKCVCVWELVSYQSFTVACTTSSAGTVTMFGEILSPKQPEVSGWSRGDWLPVSKTDTSMPRERVSPPGTYMGPLALGRAGHRPRLQVLFPPTHFPSPHPFRSFRHTHSLPPTHFYFFFVYFYLLIFIFIYTFFFCFNVTRKQVSSATAGCPLISLSWDAKVHHLQQWEDQKTTPKCGLFILRLSFSSLKIAKI